MENQRENIRVFLRCRPQSDTKNSPSQQPLLKITDNTISVQAKIGEKCCNKSFYYDKIFNEDTKQEEIYKTAILPLIEEIFKGFHCTIFAYGQTGTGKTYTIEGERSNKLIPWWEDPLAGAIPRVLFQIFQELSLCNNEYSVRISAIQIYNEEIFDLLNENDSVKLKMFEDSSKGSVWIQGLIETPVHTIEEACNVIEKITLKRQTASTLTHSSSSRSHSIFTISVSTKTNVKVELFRNGKLTMIDLAGSENIGRSGAVNKQAREAGSINQSLLTLNRVTMALVRKAVHIPYRESKLTRMLQDSIGGNCKTVLIATISTAKNQIEETLSTLEYASLAKNVINYPKSNQKINKTASLKEYTKEMSQLQWDLFATLERSGINVSEENYTLLESELAVSRKEVKEKAAEIEEMEEKAEQANCQTINAQNELLEKSVAITQYQHDIERISHQLKTTTKKIYTTKKNVGKATSELEEVRYLASHQEKMEGKMTHKVEQLIELLTDTSTDANLLHSAIERKSEVENSNNTHLKKFSVDCIEKIDGLMKSVNEMHQNQASFYNNLETCMDNIIKIHRRRSSNISIGLNSLLESYSKYKPQLENFHKDGGHIFSQLQEDQMKVCQEKPVPQHILQLVKNSNKFSSDILKDISFNHNLIVNTNAVLNANLDHLKMTVESATNYQKKILEEIKISVRDHEEKQKRNIEAASMLASSMKRYFGNFADAWSRKYEDIRKINADFGVVIQNHHCCNSQFSELSNRSLNIKENIMKNKIPLFSQADKLKNSAENMKSRLTPHLHSHLQNKENEIKKAEEISKIVHVQQKTLPIKARNILDSIEMPLNENVKNIKHSLDDHYDTTTSNLQKVNAILDDIHIVASTAGDDHSQIIAKNTEQQMICFIKNNGILQDITQSCNMKAKEIIKAIEKSETEVKYYSANFHVCKPTGETPVRKIYNYSEVNDLS